MPIKKYYLIWGHPVYTQKYFYNVSLCWTYHFTKYYVDSLVEKKLWTELALLDHPVYV